MVSIDNVISSEKVRRDAARVKKSVHKNNSRKKKEETPRQKNKSAGYFIDLTI